MGDDGKVAPKRCPVCTGRLTRRTRTIRATYPKDGTIRTRRVPRFICADCNIGVILYRPDKPPTGNQRNAAQHIREGWIDYDA